MELDNIIKSAKKFDFEKFGIQNRTPSEGRAIYCRDSLPKHRMPRF